MILLQMVNAGNSDAYMKATSSKEEEKQYNLLEEKAEVFSSITIN